MEPITYTTQQVREALIIVYQRTCQYCHNVFPTRELHVDHIYPKALEGPDALENYTLACRNCNLKKGRAILGNDQLAQLFAIAKHSAPAVQRIIQQRTQAEATIQRLESLSDEQLLTLEMLKLSPQEAATHEIQNFFSFRIVYPAKLNLYALHLFFKLLSFPPVSYMSENTFGWNHCVRLEGDLLQHFRERGTLHPTNVLYALTWLNHTWVEDLTEGGRHYLVETFDITKSASGDVASIYALCLKPAEVVEDALHFLQKNREALYR